MLRHRQGERGHLRIIRSAADDYLTVRQAASHLSVSNATVYKLIKSGEVAHVRVSNAIRIAPGAIAAYLDGAHQ